MRLKRPSASTLAVTAVLGFLLATNPLVADAAGMITGKNIKDGTVTTKDVKNGNLLAKDFKAGQLPEGPMGPEGPPGPQGPAGPVGPAVLFDANVAEVTAPDSTFVFVGDEKSLSLGENQRLMGVVSASLLGEGGATTADVGLCHRAEGAATPSSFNLDYHSTVRLPAGPAHELVTVASTSQPLSAGTYTIGLCVRRSAAPIDGDWTSGFVQVLPADVAVARPAAVGR